MILKEKDAYSGNHERGYYGHKQEQDVAFHLRREFGTSEQVRIIHDLLIEHGGEHAQIDHLVIHPYGFIIIESKSIVGEVQVNAEGEWSRSYKGNWTGMPSPIRQAELQQDLLKELLRDHVEQLLGKLLGIQTQVCHREWRTLCAVSSTAILHRKQMPKNVAGKVVKTEFVANKVKKLIGSLMGGFIKGRASFRNAPTSTWSIGKKRGGPDVRKRPKGAVAEKAEGCEFWIYSLINKLDDQVLARSLIACLFGVNGPARSPNHRTRRPIHC